MTKTMNTKHDFPSTAQRAAESIIQTEEDMSTTSVTPETPKAPPLEKQTTVGNYFVSNYPPFSFWKPEFVPELFAALERAPLGDQVSRITHYASRITTPLGIYVHIPFCRKRCHFCY